MKYVLSVYRGVPGNQYWEDFELVMRPSENIISALMEIQKNPINKEGKKVTPIVWEQGCLEEVCGSCSMLVNGRPMQACVGLIHHLLDKDNRITIAPLSKFPLVRDLICDRQVMFDSLKKVRAYVDVDKCIDRGPGRKVSQNEQEVMYALSTCMTCGCCSEACPQINEKSEFIGPAPLSQVRLFQIYKPNGKRLEPLMDKGGVADCGNAQNCVRVCPKNIPLTESIAVIGRDVTMRAVWKFFGLPESE
ncbi:succinate dehydrogenase iron-sulfur subunit [Chlamydiales bacterium]|nr:succinate dehydrogenase iron-sulfur subunit [Chlamydiales bacterium]